MSARTISIMKETREIFRGSSLLGWCTRRELFMHARFAKKIVKQTMACKHVV